MKPLLIFFISIFIFSCKTTIRTTSKPVEITKKPSTPSAPENSILVSHSLDERIKKEVQGAKVEITRNGLVVNFDESLNDENFFLFTPGSSGFTSKGRESLTNLVKILHDFPDTYLKIESYTDDVGQASDNMLLSQRRAYAVANFFKLKKISPHRMMIRWYGETMPKVKNSNAAGRAQNKRTEIFISRQGK